MADICGSRAKNKLFFLNIKIKHKDQESCLSKNMLILQHHFAMLGLKHVIIRKRIK